MSIPYVEIVYFISALTGGCMHYLKKRIAKETLPLLSCDSNSDIGRINILEILPVPVCVISFKSAGTAEPVKIN